MMPVDVQHFCWFFCINNKFFRKSSYFSFSLKKSEALATVMVIDAQVSIRMLCGVFFSKRKERLHQLLQKSSKRLIVKNGAPL